MMRSGMSDASEIRQMSASDAAQGKVIVNPERLTVLHGELR
jgi:hypothetical protein